MTRSRILVANRLSALFCVALALMFGASSLSNMLDQIQHAAPIPHEHFVLGDLTIDQDHHDADHHDLAQTDGEAPVDHMPGSSHHHHGDVSSGLLVSAPVAAFVAPFADSVRPPMSSAAAPGRKTPGPERPPRRIILHS